jgi:hypothetical protein
MENELVIELTTQISKLTEEIRSLKDQLKRSSRRGTHPQRQRSGHNTRRRSLDGVTVYCKKAPSEVDTFDF